VTGAPLPFLLLVGFGLAFAAAALVYLGALIYYGTLGLLSPMTVYQVLLWIIYLLPGVTAFWLLARILPNPWLALPGAFVTLTLSAGQDSSRSARMGSACSR
jgi:hypothetical protein